MSNDFMDADEQQELIVEFLAESDGHIQVLNENLLKAEEAIKAEAEMSDEDMNAMFRAAHTIKGTAGFFGLDKTVRLTHEMETILQRVKNKEMVLTVSIIDVLFKAFDNLEALFASLRESNTEDSDIEEAVSLIQAILSGDAEPAAVAAEEPSVEEPAAVEEETGEGQKEEINAKYLPQYIDETQESIEQFIKSLSALEEDMGNVEMISDLFRVIHTIKGSSGLINAQQIAEVAHSMENSLSLIRDNHALLSQEPIAVYFKGIDLIKEMVDSLAANQTCTAGTKEVLAALQSMYELLSSGATPDSGVSETQGESFVDIDIKKLSNEDQDKIAQAIDAEKDVYELTLIVDAIIPLKGMKTMIALERLEKLGDVVCAMPSVDDLDAVTGQDATVGVLYASAIDEREIKSILAIDGVRVDTIERVDVSAFVKEEEKVAQKSAPSEKERSKPATPVKEEGGAKMVEQIKTKKAGQDGKSAPIEISTIRIDSRKLDKLMNLSGELVTLRAQFARLLSLCEHDIAEQKEVGSIVKQVRGLSDQMLQRELSGSGQSTDKAQRVIEELNESMLEIDKRLAKGDIVARIHELDELTSFLGKISSDIQSGVMQTRMVPIEGVFTRFKRMVRDISKDVGKDVNLVIEGEDTELDKKIVDSLGDPLTHMIRNAMDHGLDTPERREELGKPVKGTVFLRASHRGNSICIDVGDDGRGIDANKLVEKALEKELLTTEQIEKMSEREKLNIMFMPGFSTAEKVTGISGRGVGMDVVRNMITAVNGVVDITTELDKGSTFSLMIPLTLAIIQALLVVINEETYAFPLELVTEIIKVLPDEIYSVDGNDTVKLRGHALSLVELSEVMGLPKSATSASGAKKVVVITDGNSQIGVVVDSLIGEDEIVIKSLTEHFSKVIGVSGASILGDGSVALILDPIAILGAAK